MSCATVAGGSSAISRAADAEAMTSAFGTSALPWV